MSPRYVARLDVTGETSDAEASLSGLADAAEDQAGRITDTFEDSTSMVGGQFDDLTTAATGSLTDLADTGESQAGRISETFAANSGKASASLDDLMAAGSEKLGAIGDSATESAAQLSAAYAEGAGKVGLSLDDLVTMAGTKAAAITASFDDTWTAIGVGSEAMVGKLGESLDAMVAETSEKGALMSKSLEGAYSKASLAGGATGAVGKDAEESALVGGVSKVGEFTLLGTIAAVAGSLDLSGKLQTAEANLRTAVKNSGSGVSWKGFQPGLNAAISQGAQNGFDDTDVVASLASLTSATKNPREALQLLGQDENEARLHGMSLTESTAVLTKILGGSTRAMAEFGYNVNLGSGKLHSVQQAQEAVTKATAAYHDALIAASQTGVVNSQNQVQAMLTEQQAANHLAQSGLAGSSAVANAMAAQKAGLAEVESGQVKGASAVALLQKNEMNLTETIEGGSLRRTASALEYQKALDSVKDTTERDSYAQVVALEKVATTRESMTTAQLNLREDKTAIPLALSTLAQRSAGAASAFDKTLPGELEIADAEVKKLAADFGEFLTPGIEHFGHALETDIGWLLKHKAAVDALGITLGLLGAASVAVYGEQKLAKGVKATTAAYHDLQKLLGGGAGTASTASTAEKQTAAAQQQTAAADKLSAAGTSLSDAAGSLTEAADKLSTAGTTESTAAGAETTAATTETTAATAETSAATAETSAATAETTAATAEEAGATAEEAGAGRGLLGGAGGDVAAAGEGGTGLLGFGGTTVGGISGGLATAGLGALFLQQIAEAGKGNPTGALTANGIWNGLGSQSSQAAWTKNAEQFLGIVGGDQTTGNTQTVIADYLQKATKQGASTQEELQALLSASVQGKSGITPRITSSILQNLGASPQELTEAFASTGYSQLKTGQAVGITGEELDKWFAAGLPQAPKGQYPTSPGSSVVHQYNMPNAKIVANDPGQLGRQLEMRARRKNSVRT